MGEAKSHNSCLNRLRPAIRLWAGLVCMMDFRVAVEICPPYSYILLLPAQVASPVSITVSITMLQSPLQSSLSPIRLQMLGENSPRVRPRDPRSSVRIFMWW
jgi:hypothetical protein